MKYTLQQALDAAPGAVHAARANLGAELFDKAVEHHKKMKLVADVSKGSTRNRDGFVSQFTAYDWAHHYEEAPHFVWFDFFAGAVANSVSRMARGLKP